MLFSSSNGICKHMVDLAYCFIQFMFSCASNLLHNHLTLMHYFLQIFKMLTQFDLIISIMRWVNKGTINNTLKPNPQRRDWPQNWDVAKEVLPLNSTRVYPKHWRAASKDMHDLFFFIHSMHGLNRVVFFINWFDLNHARKNSNWTI